MQKHTEHTRKLENFYEKANMPSGWLSQMRATNGMEHPCVSIYICYLENPNVQGWNFKCYVSREVYAINGLLIRRWLEQVALLVQLWEPALQRLQLLV